MILKKRPVNPSIGGQRKKAHSLLPIFCICLVSARVKEPVPRMVWMIVPVVTEETWLNALGTLPEWRLSSQPLLVISPHPDDETLGPGGMVAFQRQRGIEVLIVAVTDGEKAYEGVSGLAARRREEQTKAAVRLGVDASKLVRFGLPDSNVAAHKEELVQRLLPLVSADTHVVAPWQHDFHPDHEACGWAAEQVARLTGAKLTYYFFWTWHRGAPALLSGLNLVSFPLTEDLLAAKLDALTCHNSQLFRATNDPILPESLLAPARRPFEVFLIS